MTETLEQIARIVDTLEPLAGASAGEPVRAGEWNAVVGSVVDLARVVLARERTIGESLAADYALAGHAHRGDVDLSWLDPVARDLVEGGRAQRADLVSELARARRDLDELATTTAQLRDTVAALERRVATLDDRDFDRGQRLDRLGGAVDSIGEQEASIADLRRTFSAVDSRVGEALALREELFDVTGARIDLAELRGDVSDLLKVREQLRTADGTIVQIRNFEQRLSQVERRADNAGGEGGSFDLDSFRGEILDAAELSTRGLLAPVQSELGGLTTRVDTVAADVDRVGVAVDDQHASITSLQTRTAGLPALTTQVTTLQARVSDQQVRLDGLADLPKRLDGLENRLDRVEPLPDRVATLESDVASMSRTVEAIPQLEQRVVTLERSRGSLADLTARVDATAVTAHRALAVAEEHGPRIDLVEAGVRDQTTRLGQVEAVSRSNTETLKRLVSDRPLNPIIPDPALRRPGDSR